MNKHVSRLFLCFLNLTCSSATVLASETNTFDFPKKPDAFTNLLEIGPPEVNCPPNLTKHLGGSEITNMASVSIRHLLDLSGRFTLIEDPGSARILCRTTLSGLHSERTDHTKSTSGDGFLSSAGGFFSKPFKGKSPPTNSSKTVSEQDNLLDVKLVMEFVDINSGRILATGEGKADEFHHTTNGTNSNIIGYASQNTGTTTNEADFHSDLIEEAAFIALTNMLPHLDGKLMGLPPIAAAPPSMDKENNKRKAVKSGQKEDNDSDPEEQLTKLKKLLDAGLITKEQYEKKAQVILDRLYK